MRQFWLAAEGNTFGHGALATLAGALYDQFALEFGETGQDGQDQAAVRRGGVGSVIPERFERGTGVRDLLNHVQQIP